MKSIVNRLVDLGAAPTCEAVAWARARQHLGPADMLAAYRNGAELLRLAMWLAQRLDGYDPERPRRRIVVSAACRCARQALEHVPAGEERPRRAIEAAEAWCRGEATIEEVRTAAAAAYAAYAAAVAAYAAATAAYAAYAAYGAAYAARDPSLARSADIVRGRVPLLRWWRECWGEDI